MTEHQDRAQFTAMSKGTQQDWNIIGGHFRDFARELPARVLTHLRLLDGDFGGFPVDRLEHSRQTATRAHQDGRDEAYVVMALLHDIGDTLGTFNHPEIGAAMLKPFVSEEVHWIANTHGVFQGYYFFHYLGWTATCARITAAIPISRPAPNSARNTISRPSTRPMKAPR